MIRGSAKIDFERINKNPKFITRSENDFIMNTYTREELLIYIGNILAIKQKSAGEEKEMLQRIVEDLELIYSYSK